MKPHTRVLDVQSTIQGVQVKMGLDPTATAHLMGILTDRDKRRAGRKLRVVSISGSDAYLRPYPDVVGSKDTKVAKTRLQSRAYKLVKSGK